jgi:hypothetical protein
MTMRRHPLSVQGYLSHDAPTSMLRSLHSMFLESRVESLPAVNHGCQVTCKMKLPSFGLSEDSLRKVLRTAAVPILFRFSYHAAQCWS